DRIQVHSHATLFGCPAIYEPFGLVIVEAMACETAVVASRVGGIPEIVVDGETGYLVDYDSENTEAFTTSLAERIEELLTDTALAAKMGKTARRRVLEHLGWPAIAARTVELYAGRRSRLQGLQRARRRGSAGGADCDVWRPGLRTQSHREEPTRARLTSDGGLLSQRKRFRPTPARPGRRGGRSHRRRGAQARAAQARNESCPRQWPRPGTNTFATHPWRGRRSRARTTGCRSCIQIGRAHV